MAYSRNTGGGGITAGDKGDITVNANGTWTVDNVDARNVSQLNTHRLVTDSEKSTWNDKQNALVSGTDIKTINGLSILGSGDLTVTGSAPDGYTYIIKSANQDVTNSGRIDDNDFSFSVVAAGQYMVEMEVAVSGNNTTGDYSFDFQVSTGTMKGKGTAQNLTSANAIQNAIVTSAGAANTTAIACGIPTADLDDVIAMRIIFSFTASENATFSYRFGNNSVGNGRTSRTWKGSVMKYKTLD